LRGSFEPGGGRLTRLARGPRKLALEDCRDALGLFGEQRFDNGATQLAQAIRLALVSVEQRLEPPAQARVSRRTFARYFCDIGVLDEGMVIRRQRRGGQRNQATGGHDIMAAPGAAACAVRIRAIGSGSHCSLSCSDW